MAIWSYLPNPLNRRGKTYEFANYLGKKYNIEIIVSSALETHVGHMAAVHLASCINNSQSHGLDYYAFYKNYSKHIYSKNESRVYLDNITGLGVDL